MFTRYSASYFNLHQKALNAPPITDIEQVAEVVSTVTPLLLSQAGVATPYSTPALPRWRKARDTLRAGGTENVRIAFIGDSKTRGYGAGTATSNGHLTTGAAPKSKPARVGQLLAAAGIPAITDTIFGTGGAATMPDAVSYDPRLSGFSGWGGGQVSLGGAAFYTGNTNLGIFTPSKAIDRVTVFYAQSSGSGSFSVTKGPETFTFSAAGSVSALGRAEVTFTTKDAAPISIARTTGGGVNIVGLTAWDSAVPGIEIGNFGVVGVRSEFQANTTQGVSPANALATYAPALTVVNLGTNDLVIGDKSLTNYLANMAVIIDKAQISGDAIILWPAVAGSAVTGGTDDVRAAWKAQLRTLAMLKGCVFLDEEAVFGGRAGAVSGGWFADGLHESAAAYLSLATPLTRLLLDS